jgi:hypothetical protein
MKDMSKGDGREMESILTFTDPLLPDVKYIVKQGFGKPQWFRVENDLHTRLSYVKDPV